MLLTAEQLLAAIPAITPSTTEEQSYAVSHLRKSITRKFISGQHHSRELDARALQSFLSRNSSQVTIQRHAEADEAEQEILRSVRDFVRRFFIPHNLPGTDVVIPSWNHVIRYARMGPKASVECRSNSTYCKLFNSSLGTSDPDLRWIYNRVVSLDPRWQLAELQRASLFGNSDTCGSSVTFVPKNNTTSRTIGSEPPLNMFFQLGIGRLIENRLMDYGIAISDSPGVENQQIVNRRLARRGSLTGSLATLDLSHASDSLTNVLVRSYFPQEVLHFLEKCRTPSARLPDGTEIDLEIFSTMGNGFNFPLQTMFFLCVVLACYKSLKITPILQGDPDTRNIGVFGDDIIVVTEAAMLVSRVMHLLGFTINADKSYVDGEFRESCGGDYFRGHDVTPFYIKKCDTEADLYVHANAIQRWTQRTGVYLHDLFYLVVRRLSSLRKRIFVVPSYLGDDAGLKMPWLWASYVGSFRRDRNGSIRCQSLQALTRSRPLFDRKGRERKDAARIWSNPMGLHLAFLDGHIRDGLISWDKPRGSPEYVVKARTVPDWDVESNGLYNPYELALRASVASGYLQPDVLGLLSPHLL